MSDNFAELMAQMMAKVESLQATVEVQQAKIQQLEVGQGKAANSEGQAPTSRRKLLKKLAAGAGLVSVTGIAALASQSGTAYALPNFELNINNTSTTNTNLSGPGGNLPWSAPSIGLPVTLSVENTSGGNNAIAARGRDTSDSYGVYGAASFAVVGFAPASNGNINNPSRGMWGVGNVTGTYGVVAEYRGSANAAGSPFRIVPVAGSGATTLDPNSNSGNFAPASPSEPVFAPPSGGNHLQGEMMVDTGGNLHLCTTGGTPGTWVKLNRRINGLDNDVSILLNGVSITPSGQNLNLQIPANINLLPASVRIAATNGTTPPLNNPKLKATGATPIIGDSGTVQLQVTGGSIPAGAKGVVGTLTNVGATAGGNLRFWTAGIAPNAANLNIPGALPSLNLTASFVIPLDGAGKVYLGFGTGAIGAETGYVLDISGYWL
jgi:hypothetical protein